MKPLLSIIIPTYNAFTLMERCLKSLEEQTNKNFEVIFVDDCSTDNSFELLAEWLSKNCSFQYQLIQNDNNSGPGSSRNNGILHSTAKYITFIDSDDYIECNFVDIICSKIQRESPDAIIFDYYLTDYNQKRSRKSVLSNSYGRLSTSDAVALSSGMCWGKVYKSKIIKDNKLCFPKLMRSEDLAFIKVYLSKCEKIFYCQEVLYYYYVENNNSIMHSKKTLNINNNIEAFKFIQNNIKDDASVEMIFVREYLYLIVQILILQGHNSKEIKQFIKESNAMYKEWNKNKYIKYQPLYLKIALFFIKIKFIFPLRIMFKLKK